MHKLVLASDNPGKLAEFQQLFVPMDIEVCAQGALGITPLPETAATFVENALIKARHASEYSSLPALGDDSGLVVDVLGGAPGICSARYAGVGADSAACNAKLLAELADVSDAERTARFVCVLAFVRSATDPLPEIFIGKWEGAIARVAVGAGGFGYDPVFYVPTHDCHAAELSPEEKNRLSHRGQAMQQLLAYWQNQHTS